MRILTDHHVHTPLCKHASGPMEAYVERAIELGFTAIGFTDHNPLPNGLGPEARMEESQLDGYVNRVQELQWRYRGKIEVLLGMEMDYVEGLEDYLAKQVARYPWDYVIGAVHYLDADCRQMAWPKDFDGELSWLYGRFYQQMRRLVGAGLCDIIAHFDVPKRSGRLPGEREVEDMIRTLQEIARAALCIEINTSGFRHTELVQQEPYPSLTLAEKAIALGIPLTVNSDSHAPEHVGTRFGDIEQWLEQQENVRLVTFRGRKRQ